MGIFEGCLLACDVDGTLMENEYINPKNVEKIDFFINEGGMFSIATGRSVCAISDVRNALNKFSPSVVANGCMIYDYTNSKVLYQLTVPKSDHKLADFIVNSAFKVGSEIHCGLDAFTLKRTENTTLHQNYEKFAAPDISFKEVDKLDWNKAIFIFESEADREKMYETVCSKTNESTFVKTAAFLGGMHQYYLEMVPKGVSKASALEELCKIFGIKKGCYFAIGDYYNDLEMLKAADISAVPSDSPDDVKQYANVIACSCRDGAVAEFIDYLISKFNV